MEAHNAMNAKIVQESGFEAIWASGLTISASLGLRDRNEASWSQILEIVEYMSDAVTIPILMDGDTGFGNFNNVRHLVKKMCHKRIAGVCLEDKLFPKLNSFLGEEQTLVSTEEFCGKVMAAKDSQLDPNFIVVARIEALISGKGMNEALDRAYAYAEAGADAVLIHSKKNNADQVLEFAKHWKQHLPLIVIPTTYYKTPTADFVEAKISGIIWANHSMRASIRFMKQISQQIFKDQSISAVESQIASMNEIFTLTKELDFEKEEQTYFLKTKKERGPLTYCS
jgi:phosphoenolpyruvate mutase